jgi:hypothetical protein
LEERQERLQKLVGHRWMQRIFTEFNSIDIVQEPDGYLKDYKRQASIRSFEIYDQSQDVDELKDYLENGIIDFYYKKSLGHVNPDDFELRYINKN